MTIVAQAPPRARGRLARRRAHRVHQYILKSMIWHFSPHDGYSIRSLPARRLPDYLDRLDWVFNPVIDGTLGSDSLPDFGDGLKNPQQALLARAVRGGTRTHRQSAAR